MSKSAMCMLEESSFTDTENVRPGNPQASGCRSPSLSSQLESIKLKLASVRRRALGSREIAPVVSDEAVHAEDVWEALHAEQANVERCRLAVEAWLSN